LTKSITAISFTKKFEQRFKVNFIMFTTKQHIINIITANELNKLTSSPSRQGRGKFIKSPLPLRERVRVRGM
jgi:hypothetical protein